MSFLPLLMMTEGLSPESAVSMKLLHYFHYMSCNMKPIPFRYAINTSDICRDFGIVRKTFFRHMKFLLKHNAIKKIEPLTSEKDRLPNWRNQIWIEVVDLSSVPNFFVDEKAKYDNLHAFAMPFSQFKEATGGFWNVLKSYNFNSRESHPCPSPCVIHDTPPVSSVSHSLHYIEQKKIQKKIQKKMAFFENPVLKDFSNGGKEEGDLLNNKDKNNDIVEVLPYSDNIGNSILYCDLHRETPLPPLCPDIDIEQGSSNKQTIECCDISQISHDETEFVIRDVTLSEYCSIAETEEALYPETHSDEFFSLNNPFANTEIHHKRVERQKRHGEAKIEEYANQWLNRIEAASIDAEIDALLVRASGGEHVPPSRKDKQAHREEVKERAKASISCAASVPEPNPQLKYLKQKLAAEKEAKALAAKERAKAKRVTDADGLVRQSGSIEEIKNKCGKYTPQIVHAFCENEFADRNLRIPRLDPRTSAIIKNWVVKCELDSLDALEVIKAIIIDMEKKKKLLFGELFANWNYQSAFHSLVNKKPMNVTTSSSWGNVDTFTVGDDE